MTGHHDREAMLAALTRSLPYIRLYRGHLFVLKLCGAMGSDPDALREFVEQATVLCEFGIRLVIVHGGGPQATGLAERLGVESRFVEGRRVTSPQMLEAVIMALNGTVNTAVLSACRSVGLPSIGVSGVDAGLLAARVRPPVVVTSKEGSFTVDYGEVGDIAGVDRTVLDRLVSAGFVPVVSPLAADDRGRILNVNADTAASQIAVALQADKLIFLTDTPGLLEDKRDPNSLVSYTDLTGIASMEAKGMLDGGMRPKMSAAQAALAGGVKRVHVVGYQAKASLLVEVLTNEGAGTLIVRDISELTPGEQEAAAETQQGAAP